LTPTHQASGDQARYAVPVGEHPTTSPRQSAEDAAAIIHRASKRSWSPGAKSCGDIARGD